MTKVLLTGSSGFVGGHMLQHLLDNTDWEVTALPTKALFSGTLSNETYDYIIHLASASSVEASFQDPKNFIKRNVATTLNLLEYARKHRPAKLMHMSSVEVLTPSNPYAASKAAQEAIVKSYALSFDIPTLIVRAGNIIGPGQGSDKFIPKITQLIKDGETVSIYTDAQGVIGARKYINVTEVVRELTAHVGTTSGLATLEGEELVDNLAMANMIASRLHKPLKYILVQPTSSRPSYTATFTEEETPPLSTNNDLNEVLAWIK
jgi:dTDP-glucose 4,6-dehydratase